MKRSSAEDCQSLAWRLSLVSICMAVFNFVSLAQTFYGSIVGTVSDESGAVMPGAAVGLTNLATSERRTTETAATGAYEFVNLVPGRYRVEIQRSGFNRVTFDEIAVEVAAVVRVDASMSVGDVAQNVEVEAATPLLQTETSSLSEAVESRKVAEMPSMGAMSST